MMKASYILLIATVAMALGIAAYFATPRQSPRFIGSDACRACHESRASGAVQIDWQQGPHAGAYRSLSGEAAREAIARAPGGRGDCLPCHSTIAAEPAGPDLARIQTEGVGCERCHGPGSEYSQSVVMRQPGAMLLYGGATGSLDDCTSCHRTSAEDSGPVCPVDSSLMAPSTGWQRIGHARGEEIVDAPVWEFGARAGGADSTGRDDSLR